MTIQQQSIMILRAHDNILYHKRNSLSAWSGGLLVRNQPHSARISHFAAVPTTQGYYISGVRSQLLSVCVVLGAGFSTRDIEIRFVSGIWTHTVALPVSTFCACSAVR